MRVIKANETAVLDLGRQSENERTRFVFGCQSIAAEYPGGTAALRVLSPGASDWHEVIAYYDASDKELIWDVKDNELINRGNGKAQVFYRQGTTAVATRIWTTAVDESLAGNGIAPPEWQDIRDEMEELYANTQQKAQEAAEAAESIHEMTVSATTLPSGQPATVEWDSENSHMTFGIPKGDEAEKKPYLSIERLRSYLYKVSFDSIPEYDGVGDLPAGCSSYVHDGKLYRNFDWYYDDSPTFIVRCKGFTGVAVDRRMTDVCLNDDYVGQLPYHVVDGRNDDGIMMSTHVLYNDWQWRSSGNANIPLSKVPYLILACVRSMETVQTDLADIIANLYVDEGLGDYLAQYVITDGTTTYALLPPTSADGDYTLTDITENPKLTNFRWVNRMTVERSADYMQDRPTGVERWNDMTADFEELRFTKAYETPDRLSEYIGLNGTDKESTDEELAEIYTTAHGMYLERSRDGSLWQTMHSVVYSARGIERLYVQEDWTHNYGDGEEVTSIDAGNVTFDAAEEYPDGTVGNAVSKLNNTKVDKGLIGDTPASEQTAAKLLVQEEVQTSLLDQAVDALITTLDTLYMLAPQAETMEELIVNVEQSNGLLNDIFLAIKESEAV